MLERMRDVLARDASVARRNSPRAIPSAGMARQSARAVYRSAMITVTTCSNNAEAELLHSLLTGSGIEAFVLDDAFGGAIRIQVDDARAEEAKRLIEEAQVETDDEETDGAGN
jgi:hypothetical protein